MVRASYSHRLVLELETADIEGRRRRLLVCGKHVDGGASERSVVGVMSKSESVSIFATWAAERRIVRYARAGRWTKKDRETESRKGKGRGWPRRSQISRGATDSEMSL